MTACDRVFERLTTRKNLGVTFKQFATGFRLAARIKDLRDVGHDIRTIMIKTTNADGESVRYARYVLVKRA